MKCDVDNVEATRMQPSCHQGVQPERTENNPLNDNKPSFNNTHQSLYYCTVYLYNRLNDPVVLQERKFKLLFVLQNRGWV